MAVLMIQTDMVKPLFLRNNAFLTRGHLELRSDELSLYLSPFDIKRLESYSNNMLDYHVILDLIPRIAELYFQGRLKAGVSLTGVQQSILLSIGLQRKDMDAISEELSLPSPQLRMRLVVPWAQTSPLVGR